MAAKRPINVTIAGDYNDKDINRAIKDLNSLKTQGDTTSKGMTDFGKGLAAVGGAIAATFTIGAVTDFFQASIAGAMEDQKSMVALATAMENVGLAGQNAGVEEFITKLSMARGVADDELRPALQQLVTATSDVTLSQSLLNTALDISAGTGRDLSSVSKALTMASNGQFTALTRMGIPISANIIKTKDFTAAQKILDERFGGQSAAAAETYQGKMNRITVAADEAKETIGYALLTAVDSLTKKVGGVGGATDVISGFGTSVGDSITKAGVLATALVDLKDKFAALPSVPGWISSAASWLGKGRDLAANVAGTMIPGLTPDVAQLGINALTAATDKATAAAEKEKAAAVAQAAALEVVAKKHGDAATTASAHAAAVDYTAQAYAKLKTSFDAWYKSGFDTLKTKLDDATKAFDEFKVSVRDSIAGALDFSGAAQEFDENGAKVGKSFIEKLQDQANLAVGFADKVKQLIAMNLSKEALTEVLAAGAAAGSSIAGDLIAGGASAINTTNDLVTSAQNAADTVGLLAADKWFGTGVKTATDTLAGFENQFGPKGKARAKMMTVMDNLADSMSRTATVTVTTINRLVTQNVSSYATGGLDGNAATPFANGGIVTAPTFAMIGEAGPEAVIPLGSSSASNYLGGGGGNSYNITVNAGVGDPRAIGQQIVEYIGKFERSNSPVFARA